MFVDIQYEGSPISGNERIPITFEGNQAEGGKSEVDEKSGAAAEYSFRGTIKGDVLVGELSFTTTWGSSGDEYTGAWEETTTWKADIELPVGEKVASSGEVTTTATIHYTDENRDVTSTKSVSIKATTDLSAISPGRETPPEEDEEENTASQAGEATPAQPPGDISGVRDVPGPVNWPQAATGLLLPGFLGLILSLLSSLYGGGPSPAAPAQTLPPPAPQYDDLTLEARRFIEVQRNHTQYWSDPDYRALIDRMENECFGPDGRVDWERYCGFRFGDIYDMKQAYVAKEDPLLLNAREFAKATGRSLWDTGVALKDGVVGFTEGLMAIPGTVYQGWKELGGLFLEEYKESVKDFWDPGRCRWSLIHDLMSPEIAVETGKNLYHTLGEELLPINEIKRFFEGDATLEEKLWALPSGVIKTVNLIMMSPKTARLPVPAISRDATFIKSARPASQAVEAAKASSLSAEAQAEYEAYKAQAADRATRIQETVERGGKLGKEQVLDAMSDPATMRELKDAPQAVKRKFFATQAKEVYSPVNRDVIAYMEAKNPGVRNRVKSVRSPDQNNLINTDNDVVVQREITTVGGQTYWEEVPVKEWEGAHSESFARHTGFSPEKAKAAFPEESWDAMSPKQQQKVWAEKFGQETMDVKQPEAAHAFSDQPTAMDPNWKPGGKSPVAEGRAVDQPGLGMMENYKTTRGYWKGTVQAQTEAMEQGIKAGKLSKRLAAQSQARTGNQYSYPKLFDQGLEVLNRRELAPAVRDLALKNLGFEGGYEEFMHKLSSWLGGLK